MLYPSALEHYLTRYAQPELPPSWVMVEMPPSASCPTWSATCQRRHRTAIARGLGINDPRWSPGYAPTTVRNICAHHGRPGTLAWVSIQRCRQRPCRRLMTGTRWPAIPTGPNALPGPGLDTVRPPPSRHTAAGGPADRPAPPPPLRPAAWHGPVPRLEHRSLLGRPHHLRHPDTPPSSQPQSGEHHLRSDTGQSLVTDRHSYDVPQHPPLTQETPPGNLDTPGANRPTVVVDVSPAHESVAGSNSGLRASQRRRA